MWGVGRMGRAKVNERNRLFSTVIPCRFVPTTMLCMKAGALYLLVWVALLASSVTASEAQQARQRYWEETDKETLWRGRYSNCDYGFYVSLGNGVVGHGTHSPAPNHGVYLWLPDVGNVNPAGDALDRFVWVDAHYNVSDYRSLESVTKYELSIAGEGKTAFRVVQRKATTLAGLRAMAFTVEYEGPHGRVVEEAVFALRSDIVYKAAVQSLTDSIASDREQFEQVLKGFTLLPIPQGECSNGG